MYTGCIYPYKVLRVYAPLAFSQINFEYEILTVSSNVPNTVGHIKKTTPPLQTRRPFCTDPVNSKIKFPRQFEKSISPYELQKYCRWGCWIRGEVCWARQDRVSGMSIPNRSFPFPFDTPLPPHRQRAPL